MNRIILGLAVPLGAAAACAQSGWLIEVDYGPGQNSIHYENPSCTVTLSARFPPGDWAMAGVNVSAIASEPGWATPHPSHNLFPMTVGASPGMVNGGTVSGIIGGQIQFPPTGQVADPRNPMPVWRCTWTTRNFTPRSIPLSTRTARFDVFPSRYSPSSSARLVGLVEGAAAIVVSDASCYADCDTSTGPRVLDIFDFLCFMDRYHYGTPFACDCDIGTGQRVCDIFDFLCFQSAFDAGCP